MEQLNSMFTRLKRGLSTGGDNTQQPEKQQKSTTGSGFTMDNDNLHISEDEGFLLVDAAESDGTDGTTVYASSPKKFAEQSPSQYSQVANQDAERAGHGINMFATCNLTSFDPVCATDMRSGELNITTHPAIIGLPFQLNPRLQEKDHLCKSLAQLDLQTSRFDWQKYYYDFDFEQSSLTELCAMEDRTLHMNRWEV